MKSMEKLSVLRDSGHFTQEQAEAIVRTQEESEYVTKEYLDGKLDGLYVKLLASMIGVAGVALGVAKLLGL